MSRTLTVEMIEDILCNMAKRGPWTVFIGRKSENNLVKRS